MRQNVVTTKTTKRVGTLSIDEWRDAARGALREIAVHETTNAKVRAAAYIALGRVATDRDVMLFLKPLERAKSDDDVAAAAALGLGMLPPIKNQRVNQYARAQLEHIYDNRSRSLRVRGFAALAAGLRGRHDKVTALSLARSCADVKSGNDAAVLAYACGLTQDSLLLPELFDALRKGRIGQQKLTDNARAHAASALGMIRNPLVIDTLLDILGSRRAGRETKRAVIMSLGRQLREFELDERVVQRIHRALRAVLRKGKEPMQRAFAALSLAGAKTPLAIPELLTEFERGGDATLKPYLALGLGLAARTLGDTGSAQEIRKYLAERWAQAKEIELHAALSLAVGLSRHKDMIEDLVAELQLARRPAAIRAAAAEALGLIGQRDPRALKALIDGVHKGPPEVLGTSALALGLLGNRSIARDLVKKLHKARSGILQGHLTLALGHLGNTETIAPLIETLRDPSQRRVVRELAAVALGLICDPRERDMLFELDAYFNYFATTIATNELLTIF